MFDGDIARGTGRINTVVRLSLGLIHYSLFMYSAQGLLSSINIGHIRASDGLCHHILVVFFVLNSFGLSSMIRGTNFIRIRYTSLFIIHIITALSLADSSRS